MDYSMKDRWVMEQPPKPSYRASFLVAARENAKAFIYRFEVTYGLYVMDFWEKLIVYTFLGLILFFSLWKVVLPLSFACFRLVSYHFSLEPKGLYSVLERSAEEEFADILIGSGVNNFNTSLNGSSPVVPL
ncbi:hypothetical protein MPH_02209 [Macrophomina phaseolina MS6]|uniref:Uncharacterized protein n=2 Tax=Macrophomina phaseolina TaxID=35725 RepID=K2RD73_MACPH|nr:hypothetical protein MPH_02209 [Macrophomina phaseolina MS6]KAH7042088.1 hypothetical protein B0J12DRAFT_743402 [Macrophomina phaseolina]